MYADDVIYADDRGRQVLPRLSVDPLPGPAAVASAEGRCRKAKARLSAAQQESMEAGIEFLAARAALHEWLEGIWPGQEDAGAAPEGARCPVPEPHGDFEGRLVRPGSRREGQH